MNSNNIKDVCELALFLLFCFGTLCLLHLPKSAEKKIEPKKESEVILQPYFSNDEMEGHLVPAEH